MATRRGDLVASLFWVALGLLTLQQAWVMDRLEAQGADPWSAPGLVPGILGLVLAALGVGLLVRSLRAEAAPEPSPDAAEARAGRWRLGLALGSCLILVFGLIGRGLPFWLCAALFVGAFVALFTWRERRSAGQLGRGLVIAGLYGLAAGVAIHLLFQEVFLVRLP